MTIEYLSLFVSWVDSFLSLQLYHLHNSIISYPNDKRFFKNWVFHILHRLRDLLWIMSAWSSVSPIFSSLIMTWASSCVHSFHSLLKVITCFWYTFLKWMSPMILGGHSRWLSQCLHSLLLHPLLQVILWLERPL